MNTDNIEIETFSQADLDLLSQEGISTDSAYAQAHRIHLGFAPTELIDACTPANGGVLVLSAERRAELQSLFRQSPHAWSRFVPASGASSRMFQAWANAIQGSQDAEVQRWNSEYQRYPFIPNPPRYPNIAQGTEPADLSGIEGLKYLLLDLGFAGLPKAAIPFHRYPNGQVRTPLEEHLSEAAEAKLSLHFTVSPEHHALFVHMLAQAADRGSQVHVDLSFQAASTQSLALDPEGKWVRHQDGALLLRPSGHGALLPNLAQAPTAWVFVRNIDNVVPEGAARTEASSWREALAGLLQERWAQVQSIRAELSVEISDQRLVEIQNWAKQSFGWQSLPTSRQELLSMLDAPMRVCGVVRNTGEPGGGPFFTRDSRGRITPQIVESAQVDLGNPQQAEIFKTATHFNPVELVCSLDNGRGGCYDLEQFVDPETGFKVKKSHLGRDLFALEKPGLWNGSMAHWLTIFVEIPSICFAPVKTVHDLLRDEHQV